MGDDPMAKKEDKEPQSGKSELKIACVWELDKDHVINLEKDSWRWTHVTVSFWDLARRVRDLEHEVQELKARR
jgi:hypothetical protein